jgi:hypothetical protein
MKRQKENTQQDSRANIAPDRQPLIHGEPEHGIKPKQCGFRCQWRMTASVLNGLQLQDQAPGFLDPSCANISRVTVSATKTLAWPVKVTTVALHPVTVSNTLTSAILILHRAPMFVISLSCSILSATKAVNTSSDRPLRGLLGVAAGF